MRKVKSIVMKPVRKYLYPLVIVLLIGAIIGAIVVGLFLLTGWIEQVPSETFNKYVISPVKVVYISSTLTGAIIAGAYLIYRSIRESLINYWRQYSAWSKSIFIGTISTIFEAIGLAVAYYFDYIGLAASGFIALITLPLVVGMALLRYRRSSRASSGIASLKTAYVLTRGLESRTLSAIIGMLIATVSGLTISHIIKSYFNISSYWGTGLGIAILWILVTVVIYNQYDKRKIERFDLTLIDIHTPESREVKEISIQNNSGETINFAESLIRDTDLDLFRPEFHFSLKPGQSGTFEIDESFSLHPNDDALNLPLGYNLKQGGETPVIFTKNGKIHYLQWTKSTASEINRESHEHVVDENANSDDVSTQPNVGRKKSLTNSGGDLSPQD